MGVLKRATVAVVVIAAASSCAGGGPPASKVFAAAARGACGDAELAKRELLAMRDRRVTRAHAIDVLAKTAQRIDERAKTAGSDAWRLHDLAASLRVMRTTLIERGDESVASADARVTREEAGCVSAAR